MNEHEYTKIEHVYRSKFGSEFDRPDRAPTQRMQHKKPQILAFLFEVKLLPIQEKTYVGWLPTKNEVEHEILHNGIIRPSLSTPDNQWTAITQSGTDFPEESRNARLSNVNARWGEENSKEKGKNDSLTVDADSWSLASSVRFPNYLAE